MGSQKKRKEKKKQHPNQDYEGLFSLVQSRQRALRGCHPLKHCAPIGKDERSRATHLTLHPGTRGTSEPDMGRDSSPQLTDQKWSDIAYSTTRCCGCSAHKMTVTGCNESRYLLLAKLILAGEN